MQSASRNSKDNIMFSSTMVMYWLVAVETLDDGSRIYDVVGSSDECRIVINCTGRRTAEHLCDCLNDESMVSGSSAESI